MSSLRVLTLLAVLSVVVLLGTGCVTNGRYVLLKEYGPTGPAAAEPPLKGTTVFISGFQCAENLTDPDPASEPEQPAGFTFVKFTDEQDQTWDREFRALKKQGTKADWRVIGNMRNGFGMVMSHVHALNDPGSWLAETLKMDLEQQGVKVVDASQADSADIRLSGIIQFFRVDTYMKVWGDLVVDLELQPKGGTVSRSHLHTEGGTPSWVAATSEFYKPLREARQKFSWLVTRELTRSRKAQTAAAASATAK